MTRRPIELLRDMLRQRVARRDRAEWLTRWATTFDAAVTDAREGEQAELWTLACGVPISTRHSRRKPFPALPPRIAAALVDQFMNFEDDDSDIL